MSEKIRIVTPVGNLKFVNITGQGKLNYNEDGREYVASVVLKGEAATKLKQEIEDVYNTAHKKGKTMHSLGFKDLYVPETDSEGKPVRDDENRIVYTDEHSGETIFNFKTKTTFPDGTKANIKVKNAKGAEVALGSRIIGNGSTGAISGIAKYYDNGKKDGVSLFLKAVQIAKFVAYAENDGFKAVEGDFENFEDEDFENEEATAENQEEQKTAKPKL